MLALRLAHLIETHSEKLSAKMLGKFLNSEHCSDLQKVPPEELHARTHDILQNVTTWMTDRTEKDLEKKYTELGARRYAQGVRLSHFIWALGETREMVHDFLRSEVITEHTVELIAMTEFITRLDKFFDHAVYYACRGYEQAMLAKAAHSKGTFDIVASF
jgi:hypothetical protein